MRLTVHFALFCMLTGCTLDRSYPHVLRGQVNDHSYVSPIGSNPFAGKFTILVPQANNEYETFFLNVKETVGNDFTFVSFGPTASDETIYRIIIVHKNFMPWPIFKKHYIAKFENLAVKMNPEKIKNIFKKDGMLNSYPNYFAVYLQTIPSPYHYVSRHNPNNETLTHAIYIIDSQKYGVVFWIQASSASPLNNINDNNRYQVIQQTWKPYVKFLNSFKLID